MPVLVDLMSDIDTSQHTEAHSREATLARALAEVALEGHSNGFWYRLTTWHSLKHFRIFFVLFQLFFVVNIFFSKKTNDQARSRFP